MRIEETQDKMKNKSIYSIQMHLTAKSIVQRQPSINQTLSHSTHNTMKYLNGTQNIICSKNPKITKRLIVNENKWSILVLNHLENLWSLTKWKKSFTKIACIFNLLRTSHSELPWFLKVMNLPFYLWLKLAKTLFNIHTYHNQEKHHYTHIYSSLNHQ